MPNYAPRWNLSLKVPTEGLVSGGSGETTDFTVPLHSFELVSNNHNEADVLTASTDWNYAGLDPRLMSSAHGVFRLGQADPDTGLWAATDNDVRFVGVMKRSGRIGDSESGMSVEMLFHDYTTLFLEAKKFPSAGIPEYSQTLSQAWARICDFAGVVNALDPSEILPTVKALRDRIVFIGEARDVTIGEAVPGRFRKLGTKVQIKANADAWAVWQQCVGMLGLISYIYLDRCYVTTATDYYTATNAPRLIWGHNISKISEDRDTRLAGKGVIITSFDSLTGTVLEGFYPPIGDTSVRRKKVSAKKAADPDQLLAAEDRIDFAFPGIGTQEAVDAYAKRVYIEMAHQEIEGRVETGDLSLPRARAFTTKVGDQGDFIDALDIKAGDSIRVEISSETAEALGQFNSDEERADYLVGIGGYSEEVATVIVKNMRGILALPPVYLVKRVHVRANSEGDGHFEIAMTYCNKIAVSGGTQ